MKGSSGFDIEMASAQPATKQSSSSESDRVKYTIAGEVRLVANPAFSAFNGSATDQKESDIAQVEVNAAMKDMNLEPKSDSVEKNARRASAFAPTKKLLGGQHSMLIGKVLNVR